MRGKKVGSGKWKERTGRIEGRVIKTGVVFLKLVEIFDCRKEE